jgi:hypothetical protein
MHAPQRTQARILDTHNVLVAPSKLDAESPLKDFCGAVIALDDPAARLPDLADKAVYLCGDLSKASAFDLSAAGASRSSGSCRTATTTRAWPLVDLGRVPLRVHGVGVYYRRFFDPAGEHFQRISSEHTFQSLTESTKPGKAHRSGIYLTPVEPVGDALHFRLLRCSTNLSGPTENFRATDRHIVDALNQEAALVFDGAAPLNHVLAQIYHNTPADRRTQAVQGAHLGARGQDQGHARPRHHGLLHLLRAPRASCAPLARRPLRPRPQVAPAG